MKKIFAVVTIIALVFSMTVCFAETSYSVTYNGNALTFDQGPEVIDGTLMIPLRAVFEEAGAYVMWDDITETATIIAKDYVAMIQIGNEKLFVESESFDLDTPAVLLNDRTLIPAQVFETVLGATVEVDGYNITITREVIEETEEVAEEEITEEIVSED